MPSNTPIQNAVLETGSWQSGWVNCGYEGELGTGIVGSTAGTGEDSVIWWVEEMEAEGSRNLDFQLMSWETFDTESWRTYICSYISIQIYLPLSFSLSLSLPLPMHCCVMFCLQASFKTPQSWDSSLCLFFGCSPACAPYPHRTFLLFPLSFSLY